MRCAFMDGWCMECAMEGQQPEQPVPLTAVGCALSLSSSVLVHCTAFHVAGIFMWQEHIYGHHARFFA